MDCLSSEDLKGRRRNSLCLRAYAESWCCQARNVRDRGSQPPNRRNNTRSETLSQACPPPVLAKRSKSLSLIDCISVGVDSDAAQFRADAKASGGLTSELTDVTAKVVIYEAFVEGRLEAPKHLDRTVHDLYFEPRYDGFRPRTIWSLSNTFKGLDAIPQFKATAKLGEFLETRFSQSF